MAKCIGCGYCCITDPCGASKRLYGNIKECPQLLWNENKNRYACGLMLIQGPIGDGYKKELSEGAGCCSSLNTWRKDVRQRTAESASGNFNPLPKLLQMFVRCVAAEFISGDTIVLIMSNLKSMLKDDGYSEEEINAIKYNIMKIFQENRDRFTKDFVG